MAAHVTAVTHRNFGFRRWVAQCMGCPWWRLEMSREGALLLADEHAATVRR